MSDTPARVFGFVGLLIAVWIAVYWIYEPSEARLVDAGISFGDRPTSPALAAANIQRTPVPFPAAPPELREPSPQTGVIAPTFSTYIVQADDTSFERIARRLYGDPSRWKSIAQANPFVSPNRLIPGRTVLRVPVDPQNISGRAAEPHAATPPAAPAPESPARTYTIRPNDTLWDISKKFYGDGGRWRRIADANKAVLPDPDRPKVGVTIVIPE